MRPAAAAVAIATLLALAVAAACKSGESGSGQDNGTVLLTGEGAPLDTPIRGCESAVFGALASDWRKHATIAGPLAWPGLANYGSETAKSFAEHDGRYFLQKALAVVEQGSLVTIVVPEAERSRLSLSYGVSGRQDNLYEVSEGKSTWAFRACDDAETQFNGGFIVAGPQCAALDVFAEGKSQPTRVFVAFGTGERPCP